MAWRRVAHTGVAYATVHRLTPATLAELDKWLDGEPLWAKADLVETHRNRAGEEDLKSGSHVALNKKKILTLEQASKIKDKDAAKCGSMELLQKAMQTIHNRNNESKQDVARAIRVLTGVLCDLHCPGRYLFTDVKAAQRRPILYEDKNTKPTNYLSMVENALNHTFPANAHDYEHLLMHDPDNIAQQCIKGSISDWVVSNSQDFRQIYFFFPSDEEVRLIKSKDADEPHTKLRNRLYPIAYTALQKAIYRTTAVLNGLFDPACPEIKFK